MLNPAMIRNMVMGMGGAGGLLAADDAEAGRSTSLGDTLSYWKSLSKKKFKEEGETKMLLQELKDMGVDVKQFGHESGNGGNYGTLRAMAPNGDKLHSQIASSSTADAKGQIRSQLRGLLETLDPKRRATDGGRNKKLWLGYTGAALTAGTTNAQASETPNMDRLGLSKQYDPEKVQSIINFGKDIATDPAMIGEVVGGGALSAAGAVSPWIKGAGLGLLLDSGDASAAEMPGFQQKLQRNGLI